MGHNKFLSTYPSLWEPKLGDRIIMEKGYNSYWRRGDIGIIINIYVGIPILLYHIDFNNCGNPNIYLSGKYWATREEFTIDLSSHGK